LPQPVTRGVGRCEKDVVKIGNVGYRVSRHSEARLPLPRLDRPPTSRALLEFAPGCASKSWDRARAALAVVWAGENPRQMASRAADWRDERGRGRVTRALTTVANCRSVRRNPTAVLPSQNFDAHPSRHQYLTQTICSGTLSDQVAPLVRWAGLGSGESPQPWPPATSLGTTIGPGRTHRSPRAPLESHRSGPQPPPVPTRARRPRRRLSLPHPRSERPPPPGRNDPSPETSHRRIPSGCPAVTSDPESQHPLRPAPTTTRGEPQPAPHPFS
jgi:hypothetical protein